MSAIPLTFLEKKWAGGYSGGGGNRLYPAAEQNQDRKWIPRLDTEPHRNVTAQGRVTLMNGGRRLYSNPIVSGAIDEMATYAASVFIPQYDGESKEWGDEAEAFFREHDKICNIAGWPYNMEIYRRLLVSSVIVDGEMATLLTEESGWPMLQTIPSHRIRSRNGNANVQGGEYDGARVIDGCVVNDSGRTLAYDVAGEDPGNEAGYRYISTRDMFLSFIPKFPGQLRGWSILGESEFDFQDVEETRGFEKGAQKLNASIGFIEKTETGEVDDAKSVMDKRRAANNADGSPSQYSSEVVSGLQIRRYKGGKGYGLEQLKNDRPTANQQSFEANILRGAFKGMNWDVDFSLDPSKVGGAQMRVVIEKVNRQVCKIQDLVLEPAVRRFDGYRVAKVMENPDRPDKPGVKLLPFDKDWFKWTYQTGAQLTADAKYDSEIDLSEVSSGLKTRKKAVSKRGDFIQEVDKEIERDSKEKWAMAGRVAKSAGIDITTAYNSLWSNQPNGITPQKPAQAQLADE